MFRLLILLCAAIAMGGCAGPEGPANRLTKANVLPMALDDSFQIRKILQTNYDATAIAPVTKSDAAMFERERWSWGAVDYTDLRERSGNSYKVFWRNKQSSDVTVRLEYRQTGLGNYVLAKERTYPATRGSHRSSFDVLGDEYIENGRVTAWRILLIVDGKIVAFRQSYIWK